MSKEIPILPVRALPKIKNWYRRSDGTTVFKVGQFKVLEISKRPHGGFHCFVFKKGEVVAGEGYFGTSLPKKYHAVRWGMKMARLFKIIE